MVFLAVANLGVQHKNKSVIIQNTSFEIVDLPVRDNLLETAIELTRSRTDILDIIVIDTQYMRRNFLTELLKSVSDQHNDLGASVVMLSKHVGSAFRGFRRCLSSKKVTNDGIVRGSQLLSQFP